MSLFEQFSMCPKTDENDFGGTQFIDQEKVATDMALLKAGPIAAQGMLQPFSAERCILSDEKHHDLLCTVEVILARPIVALPVFQKCLGIGDFTG